MTDPAHDNEDFQQDAQLAVCEGRLSERGIPTAIRNGKRTSQRAFKRRADDQESLRQYQKRQNKQRGPAEIVADTDTAIQSGKVLFECNQKLYITLLLRMSGLKRSHIAEITDQSEAEVSRAP